MTKSAAEVLAAPPEIFEPRTGAELRAARAASVSAADRRLWAKKYRRAVKWAESKSPQEVAAALGLMLVQALQAERQVVEQHELLVRLQRAGQGGWRRLVAVEEKRSAQGSKAAAAKHGKEGGAWEKRELVKREWQSGKYVNRDRCAEIVARRLGISFSTARKALRKVPKHPG